MRLHRLVSNQKDASLILLYMGPPSKIWIIDKKALGESLAARIQSDRYKQKHLPQVKDLGGVVTRREIKNIIKSIVVLLVNFQLLIAGPSRLSARSRSQSGFFMASSPFPPLSFNSTFPFSIL